MHEGVSSVEIRNILKSCGAIVRICAKNELKQLNLIQNGFIVINMDNRDAEGEHWVCIRIENNACMYFNLFGIGILNTEIFDYISRCGLDQYVYSICEIQCVGTTFCRFYICAFILDMVNGYTFSKFLE